MAPKSTTTEAATATYYLHAMDPSAHEVELAAHAAWVRPIDIDDEDLQFGGKSLSALYEEERRRRSSGRGSIAGNSSDEEQEEERRGRERVRRCYSPPKSHRK